MVSVQVPALNVGLQSGDASWVMNRWRRFSSLSARLVAKEPEPDDPEDGRLSTIFCRTSSQTSPAVSSGFGADVAAGVVLWARGSEPPQAEAVRARIKMATMIVSVLMLSPFRERLYYPCQTVGGVESALRLQPPSRRRVRTCAGGALLSQLTLHTAKATAIAGPMTRLAFVERLISLSSLAEINLVSMSYACDRGRGCRRARAGHG